MSTREPSPATSTSLRVSIRASVPTPAARVRGRPCGHCATVGPAGPANRGRVSGGPACPRPLGPGEDGPVTRPRAVRRPAPALLRRPRGPRRRHAVPGERHPRPRHPARAADRRGRALPALRRPQPHQRPEPGPARRPAGRARRPRGGPAAVLGQPQLGPVPHRHPARGPRGRGPAGAGGHHLGVLLVLRLPASTGRTSRRRSSTLAAEGRGVVGGQGPPLLQHPRLRRRQRRRRRRGLRPAGRPLRAGRPAGVRHPLRARRHGGGLRARAGARYSEQHRQACAAVAEQAGRALGAVPAWDLVYCSRSGPPTQPWLEPDVNDHLRALHADGRPARSSCRRSASCPTTWRSASTSTRRPRRPRARSACRSSGPPPWAPPRPSCAQLVDLLEERAETARGGSPEQPAVGPWGPSHSVCPVGCCRNARSDRPAACGEDWEQPVGAAGATVTSSAAEAAPGCRRDSGRCRRGGLRRLAPSTWPGPRGRVLLEHRARGGDRPPHQVHAHRRGHRGGPGLRAPAARAAGRGAARRRRAGRGGGPRPGHQRPHLGAGPPRRDRELPLRHRHVRRERGRGGRASRTPRRGGPWPGPSSTWSADQVFSAAAGGGARLDGPLPGRAPWRRCRCGPRAATTWPGACSGRASPTTPRRGPSRAVSWRRCCRGCATCAASAAPRSTCATSPRAAWTPTSSAACSPWDQAAGVLVATEAGAVVRGPGGAPADRRLVLAAAPGVVGRPRAGLARPRRG